MTVCPASWAWRAEYRFLWLSGMTRAADGSTRWINFPFCARPTEYHRVEVASVCCSTCVATECGNGGMVLRQPQASCLWISDIAICALMCLNPPRRNVNWGSSTIRQVCVCVRACFSEESRYWYLSLLIIDLVLIISISPCMAAQEWTAHLLNPLSFGGCHCDVWVDGRFVEVYVKNVCVIELGVIPADEEELCLCDVLWRFHLQWGVEEDDHYRI